MMPTNILGDNLRIIRNSCGLTQVEVAQKAGLSKLAYSNIENSKSVPRSNTLLTLSKIFNISIDQFFAQHKTLSSIRFRVAKSATTKEKNIRKIEIEKISKWLDNYAFLEKEVGYKPNHKLVDTSKGVPVEIARKSRKKLNLDDKEPIYDVASLIESCGIKLYFHNPAIKGYFGMSIGKADNGPAIAINNADHISIERQIFTVAHELGHLLLHKNSYVADVSVENNKEEVEADEFASYFLLPDNGFNKKWEESRGLHWIERVLHVKRIFKVSYKTILRRLMENRIAGNNIYKDFAMAYNNIYKHNLQNHYEPDSLGEPDKLNQNDFMADRLNSLVRSAYEKDLISTSRAAEILVITMPEMKELIKSWKMS